MFSRKSHFLSNYDKLLQYSQSFKFTSPSPPHEKYWCIFILLALSGGFTSSEIAILRWEDILQKGGIDGVECQKQVYFRRYAFEFHPELRKKIEFLFSDIFQFPKLTSTIIPEELTTNPFFYLSAFSRHDKSHFRTYLQKRHPMEVDLFDKFFQATFGRKVLTVCGFEKGIAQQLRRHYKVKSNEEVLHLLALKQPLAFDIDAVNLFAEDYISLKLKNFDNGYHFQLFNTLHDFLIKARTRSRMDLSMKALMLLSLQNGHKLNSLLSLKISDIITENGEPIGVNFRGKPLTICKETLAILKRSIYFSDESDELLFKTNRGYGISSSSIYREVPAAMKRFGHKYWEKFEADTLLISWGRKVISVKGNHKPTIRAVKDRLKLKTLTELQSYLKIEASESVFKEKRNYQKDIYKAIAYDFKHRFAPDVV